MKTAHLNLRITAMAMFVVFASIESARAAVIGLQNASATFTQVSFNVAEVIDGINGDILFNGWAIHDHQGQDNSAVFQTTAPAGFAAGTVFTFTLYDSYSGSINMGRFRLSETTSSAPSVSSGATWIVLDPASYSTANGTTLTELGDHSLLASGTNPNTEAYTVVANTTLTGITGFRLEVLADASLPANGPGRSGGNFLLSEMTVSATEMLPEPSSMLLLGSGGLMLARRQRIGT